MKTYQDKYLKYKEKYLTLKKSLVFKSKMTGGGIKEYAFISTNPSKNNLNMTGGGSKNDDKTPKRLILFKAEWCGHCQSFKTTWEQVQKKLKKNNLEFITYDSDNNAEMMKKYNVKGFPTIMLETNTNVKEFTGMRNLEAIKYFLDSN